METRKILKNKYYLYITEFFSGVSVMAVELGASRLLAPYFSSSQIVWTIIIGTIMIAMALGNIYGGRSADKNPNPDNLYGRLLIAAVWTAAIPVLGKYVILGITGVLVLTVNTNFLVWAGFLACIIIFVFPCFLLGTVTPSLVKYSVDNLENNGKTVGGLGAFNTIGSIIGTFLPTFVTIPAVGTSITFIIFSGILLVIALIYFICEKTRLVKSIICLVLFLIFAVLGSVFRSFAFWENDLAFESESIYNYLQVKETDDRVILSTNVLFGVQSVKMKYSDLTGMYYDYALASMEMAGISEKEAPDVLILGMGSGTFAGQCSTFYPNAHVEGVEIDERITDLAHEYFDLPEDVQVTTYDGRAFLQAVDKKYDVIMVDAYQDITIPFQMSSSEFFTMVRDHLTEDGVMVVNMNMHTDEPGNINEYLADTIASVFDNVYTVDVDNCTNRELFATCGETPEELLNTKVTTNQSTINPELIPIMSKVNDNLVHYENGNNILTDDKAPVELLGMKVIDALIQDEITYYKDIFAKDGIQGLLSSF